MRGCALLVGAWEAAYSCGSTWSLDMSLATGNSAMTPRVKPNARTAQVNEK